MSNYYQNKFDDMKLKYEISEAINDISNLYLDNKPKKLKKYEKINQFWYFIKNIKFIEHIDNHILTLSLIKGIKEQYIFFEYKNNAIIMLCDISTVLFFPNQGLFVPLKRKM